MKSIKKALDILEILSVNSKLQLAELSGLSGIKKSSANRILAILVERGYVNQEHKRGQYSLNTSLVNINIEDKNTQQLREFVIPYLLKLGGILKENVIFTTRYDVSAYILATAETKNILTTLVEVGSKIPLYCTGQGKIFLAYYSEKELDEYFKRVELKRETVNTITDPNHLKVSLKMIREEGVAYDDEERILGIKNFAVGILDTNGMPIASLGVTGPSVRLTREKTTEMIPDLKKCALEIMAALNKLS